jgi:hypothetical protein
MSRGTLIAPSVARPLRIVDNVVVWDVPGYVVVILVNFAAYSFQYYTRDWDVSPLRSAASAGLDVLCACHWEIRKTQRRLVILLSVGSAIGFVFTRVVAISSKIGVIPVTCMINLTTVSFVGIYSLAMDSLEIAMREK